MLMSPLQILREKNRKEHNKYTQRIKVSKNLA